MQPLYDKIEVGEHPLFPCPVIKLWAAGTVDVIPLADQDVIDLAEACRAYTAGHGLTGGEDNPGKFVGGYADRAGIDNRANGALCAITGIADDTSVPVAFRLFRIAQRIADEPILTDQSPAAHRVRADATRLYARRNEATRA